MQKVPTSTSPTKDKVFQEIIEQNKQPSYRLDQIRTAVYKNGVEKYADITTLPKDLIETIEQNLRESTLSLNVLDTTETDQTQKILFETEDKEKIEAVKMEFEPTEKRQHKHTSYCISTQSGCAMGCTFCSTGKIGFKKNLTPDEIADQILYFRQKDNEIGSISFMGMGEPFANPNLWEGINIITNPDLMDISPYRLTISTIGLIPGIQQLAQKYPQISLTFSLHHPFQKEREKLMPISKAYPISAVFRALNEYIEITNNKTYLAYLLLPGINDSEDCLKKLISLIKEQGSKSYLYSVNLIRFNPGKTLGKFKQTNEETLQMFYKTLKSNGINVTVRHTFGQDIYAGCGQLYGKY